MTDNPITGHNPDETEPVASSSAAPQDTSPIPQAADAAPLTSPPVVPSAGSAAAHGVHSAVPVDPAPVHHRTEAYPRPAYGAQNMGTPRGPVSPTAGVPTSGVPGARVPTPGMPPQGMPTPGVPGAVSHTAGVPASGVPGAGAHVPASSNPYHQPYAGQQSPYQPGTYGAYPGAPVMGPAGPASATSQGPGPAPFVAAPPPDRARRTTRERRHRLPLYIAVTAVVAGLVGGVATAAVVTRGFSQPATSAASDGGKVYADLNSGEARVSVPVDGSAGVAPDWSKVAAAVQPSVVAIQVSARYLGAEGSGVIINSKEGYVVTNNHVVTGADQIQVILSDGRIYEAKTLGTDASTDLAVIQIENRPDDLHEAVLGDSAAVTVGEPVMAVGNPLGYDNTVTTGIVSALNRPVTTTLTGAQSDTAVTNVIQVDAAINPGNSGGPLFNGVGEVIGINSAIATTQSMSQESAGSIGVAFAIPVDLVEVIAPQLVEKGSAEHAYLGVSLVAKTVTYDGVTRQGAAIERVWPGTAAEAGGLQAGDVIVAVDSHATTEVSSLTAWVRSYEVGQEVSLLVVRDSKALEVPVTLGAQDTTEAQGQQEQPQPEPTFQQGDGGYFFEDPFELFN